MECSLNKPYPKIQVEKENLAYASLLLTDYAGVISEQTAVSQYIYQSFAKFPTDESLAKTLEKIAIVEMKHLELLGKTIRLLGANPKFKFVDVTGNHLDFWQSKFVDYTTDIDKFLLDNIRKEYQTISNYQKHITIINDKYIKKLLKRIIEDEKLHIICFKTILQNYRNKNCRLE